jgi:hypothetical protein
MHIDYWEEKSMAFSTMRVSWPAVRAKTHRNALIESG